MLATYRRESHHLSSFPQNHQSFYAAAPIQSPVSTVPLYYPTNFSTVAETPSEASFSQQQYFDLVPTTTDIDSFDQSLYDRAQLMTAGLDHFAAPPIRVQQSTPAPPTSATEQRHSMIVDSGYPTQHWGGWDDSMGHLTQGGYQVLQNRHVSRSHQRAPSTSSIGSAGPNSPYDATTSNPRIVPSDAGHDSPYDDARSYDGLTSADQASMTFSKPLPSSTHDFLAPAFQNYNPSTHDSMGSLEARMAMLQAIKEQQQNMSGDTTPAFTNSGRPSVSSVGRKSPATPKTNYTDEFDDHFKQGSTEFHNSIPTLDRTMSDICSDEIYNPAAFAAATPMHPAKTMVQRAMLSPTYRNVFTERLQAANNNHMNSPNSGMGERSPFRQGSPFAAFGSSPTRQMNTAAQLRENERARTEEHAFRRHSQLSPNRMEDSPKTISPKDAILEYHESEEDANIPLFPTESNQNGGMSEGAFSTRRRQSSSAFSNNSSVHANSSFSFVPPSVPGGITMPQQYPFVAQHRRTSTATSQLDSTPDFPAHLISMESSVSDATPPASEAQRPVSTQADTGTYTCTYHGCTLRFETPAKLQKHKRDSHRHTTPAPTSAGSEPSGMTSAAQLRNSQAGPHKCERINPSTGKPCNTIFSRPYDLTRHEDTIHNARKQKVRCQLCTEEKTFSRNDALTRHMRVVHPEVDFPGKIRRKHSH